MTELDLAQFLTEEDFMKINVAENYYMDRGYITFNELNDILRVKHKLYSGDILGFCRHNDCDWYDDGFRDLCIYLIVFNKLCI